MLSIKDIAIHEQKLSDIYRHGSECFDDKTTKEEYLFALRCGDESNLSDIPEEMIDYEMCVIACVHNGYNIKYVPREFMTQELCDYVFEIDQYTVRYIPEEFITEDYFNTFFYENGELTTFDAEFVRYFKKFLTEEFCDKLLNASLAVITEIPVEYVSEETWDRAILCGIHCLSSMPDKLKTRERCYAAYKHSPNELRYFPAEFLEGIIKRVGYDEYMFTLCDISHADHSQITCTFVLDAVDCACDSDDTDNDHDHYIYNTMFYTNIQDLSTAITNHITFSNTYEPGTTKCCVCVAETAF